MSDRFSPTWEQLTNPLDDVIRLLSKDEHLIVKAFSSVVSPDIKASTAKDVRNQLRLMSMTSAIPWGLFDTISALVRLLPEPTKKDVIKTFGIPTKHSYEKLRPDLDGRWLVEWELESTQNPNREVSLVWYISPDQDSAPIVPLAILDYVAGSVALLRNGLMLPSFALLLIALESALWDDLAAKSISRNSERITYIPVEWQYKKISDRLVLISPNGTDHDLRSMNPTQGSLAIRKLRSDDSKVFLELELEATLVGFLATEREKTRETVTDKGLAEAIQRARKANVLDAIPSQLDETLIRFRNNLAHIPSGGKLEPAIPNPSGGTFRNLDELRVEPRLVGGLMPLIVELLNNIYVTE